EAHRDERNDEAEQERHVLEEVAHVGLTARHEQLLEEHVPGGGDVRRHQDVGDGRVDVALELALGDGHRVAHVQAPCVVVSLRKTSSRLAFSGVIWRRSMPEAVAITRAMSPRGSAPVLAMTRNCVARGRSESDQPLVLIALMSSMPSMWRSSVSGSDSLPRAPPISSRIDERAVGDQLAVGDDDDARAGRLHLAEDVGGEDDRLLLPDRLDDGADLGDLVGVEARGRLVEDKHLELVHDRLRQAHALAKALGQLAYERAQTVADAALLDHALEARVALLLRHVANVTHELEVLEHAHVAIERR